uniref:5'-3' exonuclease n=1 Tax=Pseudomonas phage HRDY3 TaxID=3236930 RepID=A0AB39CDV7_9VIRU
MTLLSVDGTNTMHRAYHAVRPMSYKGFPTNAIVGYINILRANIREYGATHVLNSFDRPGQNFRHEIHPEYKGTRPKDPEKSKSLAKQLPVIVELLDAMGFAVFGKKGVEADDVIGSTAVGYEGGLAYILSGDKDFAQLLNHDHVRLINPNKKVVVSRKNCKEIYGVAAKRMVDFLMLDGDDIDNIPGIPGVGAKTAILLIEEFGKAEKIPVERFPKRARETVNTKKILKLNRQLVTIRHDLYDANTELDLSISKVNVKAFTRICEKYGLDQLKKSILK